jgi:hypothetical protein
MANHDSHFAIDVDKAPETPGDWSGASGMPICLERTNIVVGILKQVPGRWKGERAHAVPSARLLACAEFRKHIGYDDLENRRAEFIKKLTLVLGKSPEAVELIHQKSGLCGGVAFGAAAVAECLAGMMNPAALAKGLRQAHNAVREQRDLADSPALRNAQDVIEDAVQHLVPYQFETGLTSEFRVQLLGPGSRIAEIPCALDMVAEIYMATIEERRTHYVARSDDTDLPRGERNRPAPPIGGIDDDRAKLTSIRNDLEGKLAAGMWPTVRGKIDDFMIERLVKAAAAVPMSDAQKIRFAASALDKASKDGRGRYYITCRPPADPTVESGLQKLSADYPSLVILKLAGDADTSITEIDTFGDLPYMLPKKD